MKIETAWQRANTDVERRIAALEDARGETGPVWIRSVATILLTVWLTITIREAQ